MRVYDSFYKQFYELVKNENLNFFEVMHIITMLTEKVKENNINAYLIETVDRFSQSANKKEECYK
jgi:hypothetical protein